MDRGWLADLFGQCNFLCFDFILHHRGNRSVFKCGSQKIFLFSMEHIGHIGVGGKWKCIWRILKSLIEINYILLVIRNVDNILKAGLTCWVTVRPRLTLLRLTRSIGIPLNRILYWYLLYMKRPCTNQKRVVYFAIKMNWTELSTFSF